jgi:UDP-glucose 4-epimerase
MIDGYEIAEQKCTGYRMRRIFGYHLTKRLIKLNANVIGIDNLSIGVKNELMKDIVFIRGDVKDYKIFNSLKDIDFIFHLASSSSVVLFNKNPVDCFNTTISTCINILEFAKTNNVIKTIIPYSGAVYGKTPCPQSEDMTPEPINFYGIAKLTCENIGKTYLDSTNITFLRILMGYGPKEDHKGDFASPITLFLKSIENNISPVVYGDGTQSRDCIYVDDIVDAFINSIRRKTSFVINVDTGKSSSFNSIIELINEILDKDIKPKYIPKPVNYLENTMADIARMKKELKIKPCDLREGIIKYIEQTRGSYE